MKTKPKINVRLLRKVQRTILEEPQRVNMEKWALPAEYSNQSPPCGAVGCIAGWAMLHSSQKPLIATARHIWGLRPQTNKDRASNLLGLDAAQAGRLFFKDEWPWRLRSRLGNAEEGTAKYARVVSDRIEHFIKTRGAE